ncbi:2-succinyl-6-hydroxy-2,4-cyclohexadiene-1-carboxylate synthase [Bacillus thuringiensis]|uniref:Putative 2-succinyl-6-hydroxy-2,4-cyclohexadiene-1-carboxylate synthase n=1 Tax=Bacillus cereus TaxID=1396 RepID=A0A9X6ULR4_BACCE|nr:MULTISPECIES: 2-succinyl-6-hydroxy-2,4-cyclohexadiene-1-carboxylate synthase [Bacillus cereus group]PEB89137.1 2-succinyl-6-hydroxy-2,4-cyclohexadiene-1-carboxylate synthase [Bacillus thuringiensis]PEQ87233.1 2-succinyl-6-hydroxy-2,4-cyclohexadiene-1-carboxylate synthase [Bacillus cereus]PEY74601.1 2-succinyl-6-hydroxy-2,4-cyclohexadiene-1-carboxylate synthase [Bacillus thuringiensis]PFR38568.1 2-succinyl-6-hydroxy-2,4-cyclohexadiene-1-carboxylate synthase [Bacillus thuringiensis]PGK99830.1
MNVTLQGVSYEYEVVGSGEPLLLLHGFTGSMETWRSFIPSWSEQFQVIVVDLVGHGKTESPEDVTHYDIRNAAVQMKELLDYLHIEKAHILGYSMGGRLAITLACLYPEYVHSLLLENCTAGLENEVDRKERREKDDRLADKIEREGIESFVSMWENIPLFETQKRLAENVQEAVRKERLANNPKGLANSLRGMGTGAQPSWWKELHNLKIPVLLMNGEYDEKFFRILKNIEKSVSNAKFVKIDGAGHAIHVEQPEKFDTIVKGFLKTMQ